MLSKVDEIGTVEAHRFEEGKHIDCIPSDRGVNIPDSPLLKEPEEVIDEGCPYSYPHLLGVNSYDFDPAALLKAKSLTLDLTDDETHHLCGLQGNETDTFLFLEMIFHHLDPFAGNLLLGDRFLDGDDLRDVFGLDLPRLDLLHDAVSRCE